MKRSLKSQGDAGSDRQVEGGELKDRHSVNQVLVSTDESPAAGGHPQVDRLERVGAEQPDEEAGVVRPRALRDRDADRARVGGRQAEAALEREEAQRVPAREELDAALVDVDVVGAQRPEVREAGPDREAVPVELA